MTKVRKVTSLTALFLFAAVGMASAADGGYWLSDNSVIALSGALAIALAALGGTAGQGRAVSAALEGIARNPNAAGKITTPMIIGLALIESLVIYAFIIAIMLVTKF